MATHGLPASPSRAVPIAAFPTPAGAAMSFIFAASYPCSARTAIRGVQDRPRARRGIVCQRPQPVKVLGTYAFGSPGGGFTGEQPQACELLTDIPGSRMVDVTDAGHMVAGDDDVFSAAVEEFLRDLEPRT